MTAPRLLMVANELESFFNHRLPIARAAKAAGYDVHVAMQEADEARARCTDGFAYHALPLARSFAAPWREAAAVRSLRRLIRRLDPAVVHAFTLKPVLLTGIARLGLPSGFVGSITGLGSFFAGTGLADRAVQSVAALLARIALRSARCIVIVQNPDDLALVRRRFSLGTAQTVLVPGSGVDLDRFKPAPEPPGRVRIVLAARMIADKGIHEFIEASRILQARGFDAEFVLAGGLDPENRSAISGEDIGACVAAGLVTWLGHTSDMAALYRDSHIACLPSRYREGIPKSLIEAAASGRPAVTTDMPGCREIVLHERTGLVVPVRDTDALAGALARLAGDPVLRNRMGTAARALAESGFGQDDVTARVLGLYAQLEQHGPHGLSAQHQPPGAR